MEFTCLLHGSICKLISRSESVSFDLKQWFLQPIFRSIVLPILLLTDLLVLSNRTNQDPLSSQKTCAENGF